VIACSSTCFAFGWAPLSPTAAPAPARVADRSVGSLEAVRPVSFSELANDVPIATRAKTRPAPRTSRSYVLPVARKWLSLGRALRPHHDYPAWDVPVPSGTVVRSVHAGEVVVTTSTGACGTGLVIQGDDRFTYTYCHGTTVPVQEGDRVSSGAVIMLSGSSGRSTGPHLHLQIATADGTLMCPQPLLQAWLVGRDIGPAQVDGTGICFYPTDDPEDPIAVPGRPPGTRRVSSKPAGGDPDTGIREVEPSPKVGDGVDQSPPAASPPPSPTPSLFPSPTTTPSPTPSP
jgi:hypothetical protein